MISKAWKALDWALKEGFDNSQINLSESELSAFEQYGMRVSCLGLDCSQPMKAHLAIWADPEDFSTRRYPIKDADEILINQGEMILIYYI